MATHPGAPTLSTRQQRTVLIAAVVGAVSIDAVTKLAAEATLDNGPTHIVGPIVLKLGHNSGVAFGLGATGPTWMVLAVTALIIAALAVVAWSGAFAYPLSSGLVLGGAIANFVDRAGDRTVTDMIDVGRWPTFNVADIAITTGIALVVLRQLRSAAQPVPADSAADASMPDG